MSAQTAAQNLGFLRADFLIRHNEADYYQLVDDAWDQEYRDHEARLNEWEKAGCNGPMPTPDDIGMPVFAEYDEPNDFLAILGVDETREIMSMLPADN